MIRPAMLCSSLFLLSSCATVEVPPPLPPAPEGIVRIPLILERGLPWVDVRIGERTLRLLVDLGGFDTVALSPASLEGMHVTWTGRTRTTYSAMGRMASAREYELPSMVLGGVVFNAVRGTEDVLQGEERPANRAGYIGLGLLQRFNLVIDYPERELVLLWPDVAPPPDYDVPSWPSTEFGAGVNGVISTVVVDGSPRRLVWDTGASHCVLKSGLQGAAPKEGKHPVFTAKRFEVGGRDLGPVELVLLDFKQPPADGFIGYSFFAKHAVHVDFRKRRLAVRP
ncbi:MAG TPA: hypothetical protein VJU16_01705 [Planctomycetota bacterium]|nr:hypothetical protein [Planctomycetota bacterium]